MCTLIVLHRCVPERPLVVAANRDEFLDRPAEPPAIRASARGPILAPLDLEAGGTWVGVSQRGVFAGLTNLRPETAGSEASPGDGATLDRALAERARVASDRTAATALRSRGEVVMSALEAESAADAVDRLARLQPEAYNPFQLLVADGHEAWLIVYRGSPRTVPLEPGPHVVGNVVAPEIEVAMGTAPRTLEADEAPRLRKLTRIRKRVEKMMTEPGRDPFEGLARICREHVDPGREGDREAPSLFESTCVHVADRYGTRSSLLLELARDPQSSRLWTADGPPCERPFENRSSLLRELDVSWNDRMRAETR
jgi:uncharacterized protein with NRDE domain